MNRLARCLTVLAVIAGLALVAQAGYADIRYSTYNGGQQIWITSDMFAARSMDGGSPNFVDDGAATGSLSGGAYYFPAASGAGDARDWWVQYDIPVGILPGSVNIPGTWYFRARVTQSEPSTTDSDWLVVNGTNSFSPLDPDKLNPTDAEWMAAVLGAGDAKKIFQDIGAYPETTYHHYNWGWVAGWNEQKDWGGAYPIHCPRTLMTHGDGKVQFRLYEREAGATNARVDVIVWATQQDYMPGDNDYLGAAVIPEPSALLGLAAGLSGLLGAAIRRRK